MTASADNPFVQSIHEKMEELKKACAGLDDATASKAPEGRWSPKEILSHIAGPEGRGFLPLLKRFLDEDTPLIEIVPETTYLTEARSRMTVAQLLREVEQEYERLGGFAAGLTPEQLDRTAHIPLFKNSPMGEYPTLKTTIAAFSQMHVQFHIDHLREVMKELGA